MSEDNTNTKICFFIPGAPPTVTHQEKRMVMGKDGKPHMYEPPEIKIVKDKFCGQLQYTKRMFGPAEKITGPVRLTTKWIWPELRSGDGYVWKTTKPDTDNLIKIFKDCMTKVGYWKDDALVVSEITEKMRGPVPGISVKVEIL